MRGITSITIPCVDDVRLAATTFEASKPVGVVALLAPAMLVRQRFYGRVAAQLAGLGVDAITWAHRGVGDSLALDPQPPALALEHWAQRDLTAVIAHARAWRPGHRVVVIGHSMGGQLIELCPALGEVDAVVTVAATEAWWRHWPAPTRWGIFAWYSAALPALGRALDPFPAGRFGLGPDTRASLVRDWARWGRRRGYFRNPRFGLPSYAATFDGPVLAWSFTDDVHLGCLRAVRALHRPYRRLTHIHRDPRPGRVGHFGFYRAGGEALVERTVEWIHAQE